MTEPFLLSTRAVVGAAAGAGLGERVDVHRFEQRRHVAVDELRAVVGVESVEDEGERPQQSFENRLQTGRLDIFDRTDELGTG